VQIVGGAISIKPQRGAGGAEFHLSSLCVPCVPAVEFAFFWYIFSLCPPDYSQAGRGLSEPAGVSL